MPKAYSRRKLNYYDDNNNTNNKKKMRVKIQRGLRPAGRQSKTGGCVGVGVGAGRG